MIYQSPFCPFCYEKWIRHGECKNLKCPAGILNDIADKSEPSTYLQSCKVTDDMLKGGEQRTLEDCKEKFAAETPSLKNLAEALVRNKQVNELLRELSKIIRIPIKYDRVWEDAPEWANFIARDDNGDTHFYECMPYSSNGEWIPSSGRSSFYRPAFKERTEMFIEERP